MLRSNDKIFHKNFCISIHSLEKKQKNMKLNGSIIQWKNANSFIIASPDYSCNAFNGWSICFDFLHLREIWILIKDYLTMERSYLIAFRVILRSQLNCTGLLYSFCHIAFKRVKDILLERVQCFQNSVLVLEPDVQGNDSIFSKVSEIVKHILHFKQPQRPSLFPASN